MTDEPHRPAKGRMIHVRLDDETHRRLKVQAAELSTTIQQLVEGLIRQKVVKDHEANGRS